jgi:hypothetical protein
MEDIKSASSCHSPNTYTPRHGGAILSDVLIQPSCGRQLAKAMAGTTLSAKSAHFNRLGVDGLPNSRYVFEQPQTESVRR